MSLLKRPIPSFYSAASAPLAPPRIEPSPRLTLRRKLALWLFSLVALLCAAFLFYQNAPTIAYFETTQLTPSAAKAISDKYVEQMGGEAALYDSRISYVYNETVLPLFFIPSLSVDQIGRLTEYDAPPLLSWETTYRGPNGRIAYSVALSPNGNLIRCSDTLTRGKPSIPPLTEEAALLEAKSLIESSPALEPVSFDAAVFQSGGIDPSRSDLKMKTPLDIGGLREKLTHISFEGPLLKRLHQEIGATGTQVLAFNRLGLGKEIQFYKSILFTLILFIIGLTLVRESSFAWVAAISSAAIASALKFSQLSNPSDGLLALATLPLPTFHAFLLGGSSLGLLRRSFRRHQSQANRPRLLPFYQNSFFETATLAIAFSSLLLLGYSLCHLLLGKFALLGIPTESLGGNWPAVALLLNAINTGIQLALGIILLGALYTIARKQASFGAQSLLLLLGYILSPLFLLNPIGELSPLLQPIAALLLFGITLAFIRVASCNPLPLILGCIGTTLAITAPYSLSIGSSLTYPFLFPLIWLVALIGSRLFFKPAAEANLSAPQESVV